jgi:23S rRNA pseudouridine955/2504/2580 synthase
MVKGIDVLYEDEFCLVINKPAGLAVQGGKGVGVSLDRILAEQWPSRPLLVHRLDRDTSGAILAAKNPGAAALFSRLFGRRSGQDEGGIVKRYLAVCAGRPRVGEGSICLDLEIRGSVKKSETRYRLLASPPSGEFSLLELELGTGRMHQIRRHLALSGTPVLGDDKYGDFTLNKQLRKTLNLKRLLLHAWRLDIPALAGGNQIEVIAPLPAYFAAFLEQAGMESFPQS